MNAIIVSTLLGVIMMFCSWLTSSSKIQRNIGLAGMFILILGACGTQNQKYNSSDGVYASDDAVVNSNSEQEVDKTNYYKQYFFGNTFLLCNFSKKLFFAFFVYIKHIYFCECH